jgi:type II secretory ATPase GspE/PulE/Tfp pilus assembly ATPase PilB-like protein
MVIKKNYYNQELEGASLQEKLDTLLSEEEEEKASDGTVIIRVVNEIISSALENKATDIHFEPHEEKLVIRFRIDGVLHDVASISKEIEPVIVSRIKIMSGMRTDIHRRPQNGKIHFETDKGKEINIRTSSILTNHGEKLALRILAKQLSKISLEQLGLSEKDLETVKQNALQPHGMILVTGPSGSGKTTALYSILELLNNRDINICTIEDPIEYDLKGINQIRVRPPDLTYTDGLKSLLRQDPDILMIGEVRDEETAEIAINSAMTGHLVLSTFHTNNAATALPRLANMRIKTYLTASSLNLIIARRLVRKVCPNCSKTVKITPKDLAQKVEINKERIHEFNQGENTIQIKQATGCENCAQTGYQGRTGIFEVLEVNEAIKEMIMQKRDAEEIEAQARQNGMNTLLEDGIKKIIAGITTVEEVLRVT